MLIFNVKGKASKNDRGKIDKQGRKLLKNSRIKGSKLLQRFSIIFFRLLFIEFDIFEN